MYEFHENMRWNEELHSLAWHLDSLLYLRPELKNKLSEEIWQSTVWYDCFPYDVYWPGEEEPWRWFLLDNDVCVGELKSRELVSAKRKPNIEYWPTEEYCMDNVLSWAAKLKEALVEYYHECSEIEGSYKDHWLDAKRRYGVKNNPISRMVYLLNIDPEGRFRFRFEKMPSYIYECIKEVDKRCGILLGIEENTITEDYLYSTLG